MVEFDSRAVALAWTAVSKWERSVGSEVATGVWQKAGETNGTKSGRVRSSEKMATAERIFMNGLLSI